MRGYNEANRRNCRIFAAKSTDLAITEHAADDNVVPLRDVVDPRLIAIKRIAAARLSRKPLTSEMAAGLSQRTQDWLSLLSKEMLLLVTAATQSQLREHVAGRRSIRGLLAADQLSIDAYKEAMMPKLVIVDHDGRRGGGGPERSYGR